MQRITKGKPMTTPIKKRKLRDYQFHQLAEAIANKAFEHIFANLAERDRAIGEKVYLRVFEVKSRSELDEKLKLIPKSFLVSAKSLRIQFKGEGGGKTWDFHFQDERPMPRHTTHYHDRVEVELPLALVKALAAWSDESKAQKKKQAELMVELENQLEALEDSRSIVEAWPEVEPMVRELIGDVPKPAADITKPLAVLLGKFLPALPAPVAEAA